MLTYNCNTLLSLFLKKTPDIKGIQYLAVGAGDNSWDIAEPSTDPSIKQLKNELKRIIIKPQNILFLDDFNKQSDYPIHKIEISCNIKGSDINQDEHVILREFGLFGGSASEIKNSGILINYVVHPKINLAPDDTLSRTIRINFDVITTQYGLNLDVSDIDGIGNVYKKDLNIAGIYKIKDLLICDPRKTVGKIPPAKLMEFCAKAKLLKHSLDLTKYSAMADYPINNILKEMADNLYEAIDHVEITIQDIENLQNQLSVAQVVLDEKKLQNITIEELLK